MTGDGVLPKAIALFHEPGLRHDWRKIPLPGDIGTLLALVGGDPRRLAQAAEALDSDPDELLQASRFYVQEVMLFPEADDRRVLGLAADADPPTMKAHYRALQSWLHPDRGAANRAEVVYASRINAAWSRLRAGKPQLAATPDDAIQVEPTKTQHWVRIEDEPPSAGGRWLLVVPLVLALGGGWLWLVSHPPRDAGDWDGTDRQMAAADGGKEERSEPATSVMAAVAPGASSPRADATLAPATPATGPTPATPASAAPRENTVAARPVLPPHAAPLAATTLLRPAPAETPPEARRTSRTARDTDGQGPSRASTMQASIASRAVPMPAQAGATKSAGAAAQPTVQARGEPPAARGGAPDPAAIVMSPALRSRPYSPPAVVEAATQASAPPAQSRPPAPAAAVSSSPSPATPAALAATAAPAGTALAQTPAALPDELLNSRHRAAQQRADALLQYLTRPKATLPPIWGNGRSLDAAEAIRGELAGDGQRKRPQVMRAQAQWRISDDEARVAVPVEAAENGVPRLLNAALRWRDDAWWVDSVSLEERTH